MNRNSRSDSDTEVSTSPVSEVLDCASVRDLVPLLDHSHDTAEEIEAVRDHLTSCLECMDELRMVRGVRATAWSPPPGFASEVMFRLGAGAAEGSRDSARTPSDGVLKAITGGRLQRRRPRFTWGLSAAATVVLALGIGSLWSETNTPDTAGLVALLLASSDADPAEEWIVAGAPYLDALSDEMLRTLLQDIES
jgi:hypothetical protein